MTPMASRKSKRSAGSKSTQSQIDFVECFECLPVSAVIVGSDGKIEKVNQLWRDSASKNGITDLSSVCEGVNYLDVCRRVMGEGDQFTEKAMRDIEGVLSRESTHLEIEFPCHSPGLKQWYLLKINLIGNGIVVLHIDITKRKRAEEALAEEERKFRLIADKIEETLWISTPEAERIIYVSPAYRRIWGRDIEELYKKPGLFLATVHPEDRELIKKGFAERGDGEWNKVYRIIRPDGTVRWIQDKGFPVHDSRGHLVLRVGIATDITERKQLEDELGKSRNELEHRVRERTKALEEANAALQFLLKQRERDRKESQEAVLANIRHSIKPYLNKLRSCKMSHEASGYLKIVDTKIEEIVSTFVKTLSDRFLDLTPMEIRVGELVRDGHSTKEIAALLHLSPGTIRYHRENLRQKLGIKNKSFNLRTFLKNLQ